MGFVIWYAIQFSAAPVGPPLLLVSNDVLLGQYALDANIKIEMHPGEHADSFTAELIDLPDSAAEQLKRQHATSAEPPLYARIHLGYFDDPATTVLTNSVMHAAVTGVKTSVTGSGQLVTTVRGLELGAYKLLRHRVRQDSGPQTNLDQFVATLGKSAGVSVEPGGQLPTVDPITLNARNGLAALRSVAEIAKAPLVVRDEKVFIGKSVGLEKAPAFRPDVNLVSVARRQEEERDPELGIAVDAGVPRPEPRTSTEITVLGEPALRVGQSATLETRDPADALSGTLRVNQVKHNFSTSSGYTCEVELVVAKPGTLGPAPRGANGVIQGLAGVAGRTASDRTAIDVGEVTEYTAGADKHIATLKHGQSPGAGSVAPSVKDPVNDEPLLREKPIASPFAFSKCGLIVPVYPGMRALLAHNRGQTSDAIVDGFLWPDNPKSERPKSVAGDYWLALPTKVEDGKPSGRGVSDLTDAGGYRTIDAKGLRIGVGEKKLVDVGERPSPPTDETLVIEHGGDTTIKIAADGAVEIATKGKAITLKTGDSSSVTIDGSSVTVKGLKVKVSS